MRSRRPRSARARRARRPARALALLLALAGASSVRAAAGADADLPGLDEEAWRAVTFPRIPRHTVYEREGSGADAVVRATSECAASALAAAAGGIDLARTPILHWRWRVDDASPPAADPRTRAGDDAPARVYALFAFDPARASVWERARHALGRTLFGEELPGSAIAYVVSAREPAGSAWDNPYTAGSQVVSRGPLPPGVWREEQADVERDYRARFGAPPPRLVGVGIMSDTDDGCGRARARFGGLRFAPRPGAAAR